MNLPPTPQLDRQAEVISEAQVIASFIDFLFDTRGFVLAHYEATGPRDPVTRERGAELHRVRWGAGERERLMAEYFGMDYDALLAERDELYRAVSQQAQQLTSEPVPSEPVPSEPVPSEQVEP